MAKSLLLLCSVVAFIAGADATNNDYNVGGDRRIDISTQAWFSMNGIEGFIHFYQSAPGRPVEITVNLEGLTQYREDYQWHIHDCPINFGLLRDFACANREIGGHFDPRGAAVNNSDYNDDCAADPDNCEIGDLSGKLGRLRWDRRYQTFTDSRLSLSGHETIVGRSIVIHRASGQRLSCANIALQGKQVEILRFPFMPVFYDNGTFIREIFEGDAIFRRVVGRDELFIDTDLYRVDGGPDSTEEHIWTLRTGTCSNIGEIYGNYTIGGAHHIRNMDAASCNRTTGQRLCFQGDLASKCGTLNVTNSRIKSFCTDTQLGVVPKTNYESLILVIQNANNSNEVVACAEPKRVHPRSAYAFLQHNYLYVNFIFYQTDPHYKTYVRAYATGLNKRVDRFEIREGPLPTDGDCSNVGPIYDKPFNLYSNGISSGEIDEDTHDYGPIGRLENKIPPVSGKHTYNVDAKSSFLPLFDPYSIIDTVLVLYDADNNALGCTTIRSRDSLTGSMPSVNGY